MKRIKENEELLLQCEQDHARLLAIRKEMKQIEKNRAKLENYYQKHYPKDYEKQIPEGESYRILDQDSIWNVLSDQYYEKLKILKTIIKSI